MPPRVGPVLVIGGPTASGKSGLALALARHLGGTVINADSMQVYSDLQALTARPGAAEEAVAPHRLYGVVPAAEAMSAARWRDLALREIRAAQGEGRLPIVVGGTGLYLRTLMQGIADIPTVPEPVRAATLALRSEVGTPGLHGLLAERDPEMAARLNSGDTARVTRAWEVLQATGRSLADWQRHPAAPPPADLRFLTVVVDPPRDRLYAACDGRFAAMLAAGALEEVRRLDALGLDPALPAMKALGVPELRAHLHGTLSLAEATAKAQQATRNYAKRQVTWFRHQLAAARRIDPGLVVEEKYCESFMAEISSFVSKQG